MTLFIDVADVRNLVASIGPEQFMVNLADSIRTDFLRWEDFEKSPRVANYFPNGVIELMPVSDSRLYSFKYVTGHPKNTLQNMLTVMAFGVLAEVDTGAPLLLTEFTLCTALRTGATSALAAKALARSNSKVMALLGCGAQSEFQALAFKAVVGIEEVRFFDVDPAAMTKFEGNMSHLDGLRLVRSDSIEDAIKGSDIVTLATADTKHARILTPELTTPGMHINAMGGDGPGKTELHPEILSAARVFVEFEPQTRVEGDIQQMPPDFKVRELWRVLNGEKAGRQSDSDITVFDSVGFAIEDFSTLRYLYDLAIEKSLGRLIDLIADPSNAKDLYRLLRQ